MKGDAAYPLPPETVRTGAGTPLTEVTLAALREGRIDASELRSTPEALVRQAAVARAAGRTQLADNLERASELAGIPDALILEIYTALRPGRATAAQIEAHALALEQRGATRVAAFVREAAAVSAMRGLLA